MPSEKHTYDTMTRSYATVRQLEFIEAIEKHGGVRKAARALGVDHGNIIRSLDGLRRRAAVKGHSPAHDMTRTVPEPFDVRGVSTYYNKDGVPSGQWVKSALNQDKREQLVRDAIEAMCKDVLRVEPSPYPKVPFNRGLATTRANLCNVYTLTDCHVGMLAWHKESGADWDLKIARATLFGAFEQMISGAPDAATCVVNQLGDFLHQDSIMPMTPTSGHVLDSDGRFSKVVQAAVRLLRDIVDLALAKHDDVVVLMAEGNHDISSSIWLRTLFAALYENEPRVRVIDSAMPYYVHQHGATMLAFHHGHLKKNDQLPLTFAAQFPKIWGDTTKRYCHVGHRHHVEEKEHSGMKVVQHSTLAARDAYASRGGWISERQATAMTYHNKFGEVGRNTVTPEMLC